MNLTLYANVNDWLEECAHPSLQPLFRLDRAVLPYKIELTYLQKNNPEKQHSRSKNCFSKFLNYGVTWSWHHWLKHIFNVNCGYCRYTSLFLDIYPFVRISVKLQIHSKNQRHFWISRWKLRQRVPRGHSYYVKETKGFSLDRVFAHTSILFCTAEWRASVVPSPLTAHTRNAVGRG